MSQAGMVPVNTVPGRAERDRLRRGSRRGRMWTEIKKHRWHYVFLAPMFLLFMAFTVWPIVAQFAYSVYSWDGYGPLTDYVGLGNFERAVGDDDFWQAFRNTFAFTLGNVALGVPFALFLALLLNRDSLRGRSVYRLLIFLPVVTTTAVVGVVFAILLNPLGGPVNEVLGDLGLGRVEFLSDAALALPTVVAVDTWKDLGIVVVYWLAALQTVPRDLYDSAAVDGASGWKTLRHVTLPLVMPIGVIIVLLTTVRSFNAFDLVLAMTNGGPNGATEIVQSFIYRVAFQPEESLPQFGYASAISIVFGLVVVVFAAVQALIVRRVRRASDDGGTGQTRE